MFRKKNISLNISLCYLHQGFPLQNFVYAYYISHTNSYALLDRKDKLT